MAFQLHTATFSMGEPVVIQEFWTSKGVVAIETTPEAHDKDTVYSQAFTYTLAKLISGVEIPDIIFKTRNFNAIYEVATLAAKDSDQLFHDMLFYNPYFQEMRVKFEHSINKTNLILDEITRQQSAVDKF